MKKNILLSLIIFIATQLSASDYQSVRPTIFLVALTDSTMGPDAVIKAIQIAAMHTYKTKVPQLPNGIENILVYEEDEHWIIAFFQRGNGRVAKDEDGIIYNRVITSVNPCIIKIAKKDFSSEKCDNRVAIPWPMSKSPQILVDYSDKTPAEKNEYDETEKQINNPK